MIRHQREFFESEIGSQRLLFVSRYPQSTDLRSWLQNIPNRYIHFGDFDLAGIHILRSGLFLGEIKKGRFEPSTAFARALSPGKCRKVISFSSDSIEVLRYLKCETLSVDPDLPSGWYLVCVDHYPLGWAKIASGTLKNKYPPGWRMM